VASLDVGSLPKVELHLHLDCSLSHRGIRRLRPSVTRDEYMREYVAPARCTNLAEFLACVPKLLALLQSVEGLQVMVDDVFDQLREDGIVYAELRFAPLLHLEQGLTPDRIVETVDATVSEMVKRTGIEARIILCTLRHFTEQQSLTTAELAHAFSGRRVVGLDLAGDEAGFPIAPHAAAFRFARDHGLHTTAHAGESRGAESVWETLRTLSPARIGHGIRSIEDPRLVDHLRDSSIHLEVCPSSNVQTGAAASWPVHPVDRLQTAGVPVSVNTDTRGLTQATLNKEYALLTKHFGWTADQLLIANRIALRHAFLDEGARATLLSRLQPVVS
jgi:adenosine deaminase